MMITARPRRAFWGDVRFLVGLLLVVLSIGGVWLLISNARDTNPVLQATRTIVQGEALSSSDFQVVDANLGTATHEYIAPQDLNSGMVAARTIADGELLSRAGTATGDSTRTTTLVVSSSAGIPAEVGPGSTVELWFAPPTKDGRGFEKPRILVTDAVVASLVKPEGMVAKDTTAVEVVVDRVHVADVLSAIASGAALSVVPVGAGS